MNVSAVYKFIKATLYLRLPCRLSALRWNDLRLSSSLMVCMQFNYLQSVFQVQSVKIFYTPG